MCSKNITVSRSGMGVTHLPTSMHSLEAGHCARERKRVRVAHRRECVGVLPKGKTQHTAVERGLKLPTQIGRS